MIREADRTKDFPAILGFLREVAGEGDTFALDESVSDEEILSSWFPRRGKTFVIEVEGTIAGVYKIQPNHFGRGSHIANAGYLIGKKFRGKGLGLAMAEDSLVRAKELGYRAMQFNLVVSTNEAGVGLWKKVGLKIIGTIPGGFKHREKGFVDAYVMYKAL